MAAVLFEFASSLPLHSVEQVEAACRVKHTDQGNVAFCALSAFTQKYHF